MRNMLCLRVTREVSMLSSILPHVYSFLDIWMMYSYFFYECRRGHSRCMPLNIHLLCCNGVLVFHFSYKFEFSQLKLCHFHLLVRTLRFSRLKTSGSVAFDGTLMKILLQYSETIRNDFQYLSPACIFAAWSELASIHSQPSSKQNTIVHLVVI